MVIIFFAFALVVGGIDIVAGVRVREGWSIAEGVISVLFGAVILIVGPALTALALLYLVAASTIITGIARIVAAIQLRRMLDNEGLLISSGGGWVIFGFV